MRAPLIWQPHAVRRRGAPRRWPRELGVVAGHRAAAVPSAASAIPTSPRGSSSRRSITCTIRWRSPTWARPSIGSCSAIAQRERIAIHGDYDVDGITSTVILRRALELLGADVVHFIPERLRTATACSRRRSSACTPTACTLIVSVDCGIRGAEAARRARELGVDLIITDHHEPDTELPRRAAR